MDPQQLALVNLGGTWVNTGAIEAIAPYVLSPEQPAVRVYLSAESVIIRGIGVAKVVDLIREAMRP